jgi:glycosyltransferase involved in cell wall biosynthesis
MQRVDFLLVPSLSENASNVILEAQLSGLPVVARRVGGNPELISDGSTGFLYDGSTAQLFQTMLEAKKRSLEELRNYARSSALKRSDDAQILKSYLSVYQSSLR